MANCLLAILLWGSVLVVLIVAGLKMYANAAPASQSTRTLAVSPMGARVRERYMWGAVLGRWTVRAQSLADDDRWGLSGCVCATVVAMMVSYVAGCRASDDSQLQDTCRACLQLVTCWHVMRDVTTTSRFRPTPARVHARLCVRPCSCPLCITCDRSCRYRKKGAAAGLSVQSGDAQLDALLPTAGDNIYD